MESSNSDAEPKELNDSGICQDESMSKNTSNNGSTGRPNLLDLSDDVLLMILKYCAAQDLKALGFSCSRLATLIVDRTLWQRVEARSTSVGVERMKWFLQHGLCGDTSHLYLCGFAKESKGYLSCLGNGMWVEERPTHLSTLEDAGMFVPCHLSKTHRSRPPSLFPYNESDYCGYPAGTQPINLVEMNTSKTSNTASENGVDVSEYQQSRCPAPRFTFNVPLLNELKVRCPNLHTLELEYCNIDCRVTGFYYFPRTLKRLSLLGSKCYNQTYDKSFLFRVQDYLTDLEELDLSCCSWLEPCSILPISKLPSLTKLYMRRCCRMNEFVAYASLATRYGFHKLEVIDLRESPVGDSEVSSFGWVRTLKELYACPAKDDLAEISQPRTESELDTWENDEPEFFKNKPPMTPSIFDPNAQPGKREGPKDSPPSNPGTSSGTLDDDDNDDDGPPKKRKKPYNYVINENVHTNNDEQQNTLSGSSNIVENSSNSNSGSVASTESNHSNESNTNYSKNEAEQMNVDASARNTEMLNRLIGIAVVPSRHNANVALVNIDYNKSEETFKSSPISHNVGTPKRRRFTNNLIVTINADSDADENENECSIIDHNVPPNPLISNISKEKSTGNTKASNSDNVDKNNSNTKDNGNSSGVNEDAGTSERNNFANTLVVTIKDGSEAAKQDDTPSTNNNKQSTSHAKAAKSDEVASKDNAKTKEKSQSSRINEGAGTSQRNNFNNTLFVSIKEGSDTDDGSDDCKIIDHDNSSTSNNNNVKSKTNNKSNNTKTVKRDSVAKSDNNAKTKGMSKSVVVNESDERTTTKRVYSDNSLFVTIKDGSDSDDDIGIIENDSTINSSGNKEDDNPRVLARAKRGNVTSKDRDQSPVVNEGAGTSKQNNEIPNSVKDAAAEGSDFNGDVTPTIIRFVRNNNILCENVVRDEGDEAEAERRRPTLARPVLLCPPESLDRIPQNNILYVNVSRRLSNTYRLTIPSDVFNSQSLRAICHMPGSLDSSNYVTDYTVYRFGRSDGDPHLNYIQIGPNVRHNNNAFGMRPNHSNLQVLSLTGYRNITDRSLVHLSTAAPYLRLLDLSGTRVTQAGVEKFRSLRPECEVVWSDCNEE